MLIKYLFNPPKIFFNHNEKKLFIALLLIIPGIFLLSNIPTNYVTLLVASIFLLLFVFNFNLIFKAYVLFLFVGASYYYFTISEIIAPFLFLSFLISYKFELKELKNPLIFPFSIFLLCIIPSFINSDALTYSIMLSYRLLAFFLIFTFTSLYFTSYKRINNFIVVYILGAILNAAHVIFLTIQTGKRVFGFSGIMFVDLVSIAIIICLIGFLYKVRRRFVFGISLLILLTSLIFTQTRGIWIVCGLTMIGILVQSCFNSEKSSISKSKIIFTIIFVIITSFIMVYLLKEVNPGTFKRVEVSQTERPINETGISSLATRVFIWKTAWNAFLSNPFIGIGMYSFPFTSKNYSDIDPYLHKLFVENLTPHTTILALLAEVGLLGFMGFIFFLFKTISFARQNLKQSFLKEQWYYSTVIFWVSIYISLSMIVTDAWLWGTLLMLWGIILSISIANYRLILITKSKEDNIVK